MWCEYGSWAGDPLTSRYLPHTAKGTYWSTRPIDRRCRWLHTHKDGRQAVLSAILGVLGNVYDVVATYDTYVEYQLSDPTLNGWNYQPVYAARWVEPTVWIQGPARLWGPLPVVQGPQSNISNGLLPSANGNQGTSTTIVGNATDPLAEVPEPSYGLVLALLMVVFWFRMKRVKLTHE